MKQMDGDWDINPEFMDELEDYEYVRDQLGDNKIPEKYMTKEELIEYFIEQLGDNEILGKYMTIEEIRERLNLIIGDVTYEYDEYAGGLCAMNKDGTVRVNIAPNQTKIDSYRKYTIVHELLHALSASAIEYGKNTEDKKRIKEKIGFYVTINRYDEIKQYDETKEGTVKLLTDYNDMYALNEGMTEFFARKISGTSFGAYDDEIEIYKIVSLILGEDTMQSKYFEKAQRGRNSTLSDIFKSALITKYGEGVGEELNKYLKKVAFYSDTKLDGEKASQRQGKNEERDKLIKQAEERLNNTLYGMVEKIINNERDVSKKVELINEFADTKIKERLDTLITKDIIPNIVNNEEINFETKIELLKKIKIAPSPDSVRDFIFESNETASLTGKEKLEKYYEICGHSGLYKSLVRSGMITEDIFNKEKLFEEIISKVTDKEDTLEEIIAKLENIKYTKVGNYYAVRAEKLNLALYKTNGEKIKFDYWDLMDNISPNFISKKFKEVDDCTNLDNNFKSIMEEYESRLEPPYNYISYDISEKIIMISDLSELRCFYSVNQDGTLDLLEERRRKKIYR